MSSKRKHKTLALKDKIDILKMLDRGENMCKLAKEYGIGRATIYDLKRNKQKIVDHVKTMESGPGKRKTLRVGNCPKMENALYMWFLQQHSKRAPVSGEILKAKAIQFYKKNTEKDDFRASDGWLDKFKKRFGIRLSTMSGEKLLSDESAVQPCIQHFENKVEELGLLPDQVSNADEKGLFWRRLPNKTLVSSTEANAPGRKPDHEPSASTSQPQAHQRGRHSKHEDSDSSLSLCSEDTTGNQQDEEPESKFTWQKSPVSSPDNAAVNKGGQNQKDEQAMLVDEEVQKTEELAYICSGCKRNISGVRYKCVQCNDYDVCAACEARGVHALHYALRVPEHSAQDEVLRVIEAIRRCLSEHPSTIIVPEVKEEIKEELEIKVELSDVEESDPLSTLEEQEVPQGSGREQTEIDLIYTHSSQQSATTGADSADTPYTTNTAAHYYRQMASTLNEDLASDMASKPQKCNITVSSTSKEKRNLMLTVEDVDSCQTSKLMRTSEHLESTPEIRSSDQKIQLGKRSLPPDVRASSLNQPLKINFQKIKMSPYEPTVTDTDKYEAT